jgi:hypothetical protein
MTDNMLLDAVADAIEKAGCPGREGPYGSYDYSNYNGESPPFVVRDFRDPNSAEWGTVVWRGSDSKTCDEVYNILTRRHIAAAAIRACRFLNDFQLRVRAWTVACFGVSITEDKIERNHRFLEEALELVQALDCSREEAHQLVDYVFDRPAGKPMQELGGVMVTVAALANANQLDLDASSETELDRCWINLDRIRAKQAAKPKQGPLPAGHVSLLMRMHDSLIELLLILGRQFENFPAEPDSVAWKTAKGRLDRAYAVLTDARPVLKHEIHIATINHRSSTDA